MAWGSMPKPPGKKKRLSSRVTGGLAAQGKTGGAVGPPEKVSKVGRSVLNDRMPGNQSAHKEIVNAIEQPIQWGKPKLNTEKGNARSGSEYREGTDPKTGETLHLYQAEAGGIPREIFRIKKKLSAKLK